MMLHEEQSPILKLIQNQRYFFSTHQTKDPAFRIHALRTLKNALRKYEPELMKALWTDLHKSAFESYETEIGLVYKELSYFIRKTKKWSKPERKRTPLALWPSSSRIYREPYGVVLLKLPWNYPVLIMLSPLLGSIAAGNCTVIKVSPYTPSVADVLARMIAEFFPPEYITVVQGNREVNQFLLKQRFDYIFFTGSPALGKVVMEAAAKHLTPVTLELGGKSPCIIADDADVAVTARRVVWGKFVNAGQTCTAPDYLLVAQSIKERLVRAMTDEIHRQFGADPKLSPDLGRVVNNAAWERLNSYLVQGRILYGGHSDPDDRYIAPTLIEVTDTGQPLMQEEIFGPILPLLEYETLDEAIDFVNRREKPLALYCFTSDNSKADYILSRTSSGGGCVNDFLIHLGNHYLPFGGVGNSGMGEYHGRYSFETFSNRRSVVKSSFRIDLPVRYAPYTNKIKILRRLLK